MIITIQLLAIPLHHLNISLEIIWKTDKLAWPDLLLTIYFIHQGASMRWRYSNAPSLSKRDCLHHKFSHIYFSMTNRCINTVGWIWYKYVFTNALTQTLSYTRYHDEIQAKLFLVRLALAHSLTAMKIVPQFCLGVEILVP